MGEEKRTKREKMGKEKGGRDADDAVRMGIRDGKKKKQAGRGVRC